MIQGHRGDIEEGNNSINKHFHPNNNNHHNNNFSQLQYLLTLAHSQDEIDQQKAAVELSKIVDGTFFPAVSFGPLAHALCRLLPSQNRMVASYAARAVKVLLLDDALRPQAVICGIPEVLVEALLYYTEEIPCVREQLAALQTLTWDRLSVKQVVEAGCLEPLLDFLYIRDNEVCTLALANLANILSYIDSIFLINQVNMVDKLNEHFEQLFHLALNRMEKLTKCYATACLSNACSHPVLAGKIKEINGIERLEQIENKNKNDLQFGATKIVECAATALAILSPSSSSSSSSISGKNNIDNNNSNSKIQKQAGVLMTSSYIARKKYSFKWGNKPTMELTFDGNFRNKIKLIITVIIWVITIMYVFHPIFLSSSSS